MDTEDTGAVVEAAGSKTRPEGSILDVQDKLDAKVEKEKAKIKAKLEKELAAKVAEKAKVKAAKDAEKAKVKAAKAADKAKADKAKAAAKAEAEKELAKVMVTTTKELAPVAKEVNVRLEKAAKLESDADDHRLAAAIQLASAAKACEAAGVSFKEWSEKNVNGQSYETVRKLLAVGKADDPKLALADMRGKNKEANKKLRKTNAEALAAAKEHLGHDDDAPEGSDEAGEGDGGTAGGARTTRAAMILVGIDALKAAFGELKAADKMAFTEWCAVEIGSKLVTEF